MKCPKRFINAADDADHWRHDGTCSYCGSLRPERFLELVDSGVQIEPTDKDHKVYIGGKKFYFQHLNKDQMLAFIELWNEGTLNLAYPGYFYVLPFFIQVEDNRQWNP